MKLSSSESLYAFFGWMADRHEHVHTDSLEGVKAVIDALGEFSIMQGLPEAREGWHDLIVFSSEQGAEDQ